MSRKAFRRPLGAHARRVALLGLMLCLSQPARAGIIAADNLIDNPIQFSGVSTGTGFQNLPGLFSNEASAQPFVAQASGAVESIALLIAADMRGAVLVVSIREATPTGPGAVVGSAQFNDSLFPDDYFPQPATVLDMSSSGANLIAGNTYFLTLTSPSPVFQSERYRSHVSVQTPKSFGMGYWFSFDSVSYEKVYPIGPLADALEIPLRITVVPEPSSVALGVLALAGLTAWGWRRRSGRESARRCEGI